MSEVSNNPSLDRLLLFSMGTADQTLAYAERLRAALARLMALHDADTNDDDGDAWGPALEAARKALAE